MSKWKYSIGDIFKEDDHIIQIVGLGNSRGCIIVNVILSI